MSVQFRDVDAGGEWDDFVTAHPEANFLHSWQWGEFHVSRGRQVVRRGAYDGDKLVAVYEGEVEKSRRGTYMAIAGGPIMDWSNRELVEAVFADIAEQGKVSGCVFVRVRPQIELSDWSERLFGELGLRPAPMYLSVEHAGILDLNQPEDEILKGMRQRLRRALRKAAKNDITVETSVDSSDIDEFYRIQMETANRHGFVAFGKEFLKKQFKAFADKDQVVLYTARHNGEILAQNFMIFYGNEASYHYGVSTELGTRLSGAPLLHMQAMRDARERGIKRYNFWGIVDEDDTKHRFYGVSVFKRGFGVVDLKYLPAHDLVLKPLHYRLTLLIETLRRKRRRV